MHKQFKRFSKIDNSMKHNKSIAADGKLEWKNEKLEKWKIGQTSCVTFDKCEKKITEQPSNNASKINIEALGMHKEFKMNIKNTE